MLLLWVLPRSHLPKRPPFLTSYLLPSMAPSFSQQLPHSFHLLQLVALPGSSPPVLQLSSLSFVTFFFYSFQVSSFMPMFNFYCEYLL